MGILISFTLLIAMLANLLLLPSFLMWLDQAATTKSFKEPLLEILDEEEDIELEYLQIKPIDNRTGLGEPGETQKEKKK